MALNLEDYVATIKDFPTKGILFRDVTPMVNDGAAYREAIDQIAAFGREVNAELVAGPESRGFIFGCPVAYAMGVGFTPVRKPGKLPRETVSCRYDLEYGSNELHIHKDSVKPGQRVLIVDDLLATGGTLEAVIKLIEELGGVVAGIAFVIELTGLDGMKAVEGYNVFRMMTLSDK
ncbi:MAG: adenine phosphoribosyltransferase [Solobacterium sp.]|nr:adenine phosphoribosyltransferase [Solobacterium sp.]